MKSSYTNFDDLLADVYSGVENILCKDVAPTLETKLKQSAETNVHPKDLSQANDGGITAAKNIVSNVTKSGDTFTLVVKDIAKPQGPKYGKFDEAQNAAMGGTMFANWIEHGLWMDLNAWRAMGYPQTDDKPKRPAREFVSPVQVEAAMIVKTALHGL